MSPIKKILFVGCVGLFVCSSTVYGQASPNQQADTKGSQAGQATVNARQIVDNDKIDAQTVTVNNLSDKPLSSYVIAWWQWLMQLPEDYDLVADKTGKLCNQNQHGDVWYLTGSYGNGKITRDCTIPQDKYIFVPISNNLLWDSTDSDDCKLLQTEVGKAANTTKDLFLELDGQQIPNIETLRVQSSQCFSIPNENNNYAADGYYALLKPLTVGNHTIRFGNKTGDDGKTTENSSQDVEYQILVK